MNLIQISKYFLVFILCSTALCKAQNERQTLEARPVVNEDSEYSGANEYVGKEGRDTMNMKSDDPKAEIDKTKDFVIIQETKLEGTSMEIKDILSIVQAQGTQLKQNADEIKQMSATMKQKDRVMNEMEQNIVSLRNKVIELERTVEKVSNKSVEERLNHLEEMQKLSSVRSCYELEQYGIKTSNTYQIDPDGVLIGEAPFPVYCDFEKGQTQIPHNREYPVEVEHCEGKYCFEMDIDYGVPMSQLNALIDISATCTQRLTFSCFLAPLSVIDDPVGVWVNRQNHDEVYFTGIKKVFILLYIIYLILDIK